MPNGEIFVINLESMIIYKKGIKHISTAMYLQLSRDFLLISEQVVEHKVQAVEQAHPLHLQVARLPCREEKQALAQLLENPATVSNQLGRNGSFDTFPVLLEQGHSGVLAVAQIVQILEVGSRGAELHLVHLERLDQPVDEIQTPLFGF